MLHLMEPATDPSCIDCPELSQSGMPVSIVSEIPDGGKNEEKRYS